MEEPVPGRRLTAVSDQCPGTVQWADPGRRRMGVRWDDGTTSTEDTDDRGDPRWQWTDGLGHVCAKPWCLCPADGEWMYYAPTWGEHACQRADCVYAHGPGPGGGWVGTPPPTWEPGS